MRADQHFCRNLQISCMKLGICAYYVLMETTITKEIKMSKFRETQTRKYRRLIRKSAESRKVREVYQPYHTYISATEGREYCQEIPTEIHVVIQDEWDGGMLDITLNAEMIAEIVRLDKAIKKDGGYSRPAEG